MHNCQNCYDCENCKVCARPPPPQFPPFHPFSTPAAGPPTYTGPASTGTATTAVQNCVDCHGCENLVNCRGLKNESNKQNVDASYYAGAPPPSAPPAVGYPAPPGGSGYPPPGAATGYPPPGAAVQPVRHARPLTPLERAEATFRQFDHDHNGRLDIGEFANVLVAMGMISSASAPSVQKTVQIEFEKVDKDRRGITLAEFRPYFFHLMRLADRHAPGSVPAAMDPPAGAMRPYHQTRQPGPVTRKKQGGGVGAAGLVGAAAVGVGAGALAVNPGLAGDALGAVGDVAGDAVAWGGGAFESAADFTGACTACGASWGRGGLTRGIARRRLHRRHGLRGRRRWQHRRLLRRPVKERDTFLPWSQVREGVLLVFNVSCSALEVLEVL